MTELPQKDKFDFWYSYDTRTLKLPIENGGFRAVMIQVDAARVIDLSGGVGKIEEVLLRNCKELRSVTWLSRAACIKRLKVVDALHITQLDLTALTGLEELYILNCPALTSVIGLGVAMKKINIHGVGIKKLNVSHLQELTIFNVATTANEFSVDLSRLSLLESVSVEVTSKETKENNTVICNLNGCGILHTLHLDCGAMPVSIDVAGCSKLKTFFLHSSNKPEVIGLSKEKVDKLICADKKSAEILKKQFSAFEEIALKLTSHEDDIETIIQQSGASRSHRRASMVVIHLLGIPEHEVLRQSMLKSERRDTLFQQEVSAMNLADGGSHQNLATKSGYASMFPMKTANSIAAKELKKMVRTALSTCQPPLTEAYLLHYEGTIIFAYNDIVNSMPSIPAHKVRGFLKEFVARIPKIINSNFVQLANPITTKIQSPIMAVPMATVAVDSFHAENTKTEEKVNASIYPVATQSAHEAPPFPDAMRAPRSRRTFPPDVRTTEDHIKIHNTGLASTVLKARDKVSHHRNESNFTDPQHSEAFYFYPLIEASILTTDIILKSHAEPLMKLHDLLATLADAKKMAMASEEEISLLNEAKAVADAIRQLLQTAKMEENTLLSLLESKDGVVLLSVAASALAQSDNLVQVLASAKVVVSALQDLLNTTIHQSNVLVLQDALHEAVLLAQREERSKLIQDLQAYKKQYAISGTGFKAGLNKQRMVLVDGLIDGLKSHQILPAEQVNASLRELSKDSHFRASFGGRLDMLKQALQIKPMSPRHKSQK